MSQTDKPLTEASWEEPGSPSSQVRAASPGLQVLGVPFLVPPQQGVQVILLGCIQCLEPEGGQMSH